MFTHSAQPGLWFIAGSFAQCRIYSQVSRPADGPGAWPATASPALARRWADGVNQTKIAAPISAAAALIV